MISLICATSQNGIIGHNGQIPWHLSADLRRFKRLTMGHPIIMGRKTYQSIGRPLPGRTNIVVTRQPDFQAEGCLIAHSVEEALALVAGDEEIFITGGTAIYQAGLAYADRIYLTVVHHDFAGDTPLFDFDQALWQQVSREDFEPDEKNPYHYSYLLFEKVKTGVTPQSLKNGQ